MPESGRPGLVNFIGNSHVRRRLLERLVGGPMTPTELATVEKKHVSHVSRALTELRSKGIVEQLPTTSREIHYRLTAQGYVIYTILARAR